MARLSDGAFPAYAGQRLGGIPGVRAVTLAGSRAEGTHRPDTARAARDRVILALGYWL